MLITTGYMEEEKKTEHAESFFFYSAFISSKMRDMFLGLCTLSFQAALSCTSTSRVLQKNVFHRPTPKFNSLSTVSRINMRFTTFVSFVWRSAVTSRETLSNGTNWSASRCCNCSPQGHSWGLSTVREEDFLVWDLPLYDRSRSSSSKMHIKKYYRCREWNLVAIGSLSGFQSWPITFNPTHPRNSTFGFSTHLADAPEPCLLGHWWPACPLSKPGKSTTTWKRRTPPPPPPPPTTTTTKKKWLQQWNEKKEDKQKKGKLQSLEEQAWQWTCWHMVAFLFLKSFLKILTFRHSASSERMAKCWYMNQNAKEIITRVFGAFYRVCCGGSVEGKGKGKENRKKEKEMSFVFLVSSFCVWKVLLIFFSS